MRLTGRGEYREFYNDLMSENNDWLNYSTSFGLGPESEPLYGLFRAGTDSGAGNGEYGALMTML
jgi:hypothetical protein